MLEVSESHRSCDLRRISIGSVSVPPLLVSVALVTLLLGCDQIKRSVVPLNEPPTALSFVPRVLDENPLAVRFTAMGMDPDGNITTFEWDFGDGTRGEGKQITHIYPVKGIYFVSLTATDDDGFSTTTVAEPVAVPGDNLPPIASIRAEPSTGRAPLTVEFSAAESRDDNPGDKLTFRWRFTDNGAFQVRGATTQRTYRNPGTITVTVRVTDTLLASDEASVEIVVVQ